MKYEIQVKDIQRPSSVGITPGTLSKKGEVGNAKVGNAKVGGRLAPIAT